MSATNSNELNILVEDNVAKAILLSILPSSIRSRSNIEIIGSATALARQLAANFKRERRNNIIVIFDGDQKSKESDNINCALLLSECKDKDEFRAWMKSHIEYLLGDTWPESWLIKKCSESMSELASIISINEDELTEIIESGLQAEKHNEFYEIGNLVGLSEQDTLNRFCICLAQQSASLFSSLIEYIENKLND